MNLKNKIVKMLEDDTNSVSVFWKGEHPSVPWPFPSTSPAVFMGSKLLGERKAVDTVRLIMASYRPSIPSMVQNKLFDRVTEVTFNLMYPHLIKQHFGDVKVHNGDYTLGELIDTLIDIRHEYRKTDWQMGAKAKGIVCGLFSVLCNRVDIVELRTVCTTIPLEAQKELRKLLRILWDNSYMVISMDVDTVFVKGHHYDNLDKLLAKEYDLMPMSTEEHNNLIYTDYRRYSIGCSKFRGYPEFQSTTVRNDVTVSRKKLVMMAHEAHFNSIEPM